MAREIRKGKIIGGRYRIDKPLARGGFALIYEATDLENDERVVIKTLSRTASKNDAAAFERFSREAEVATLLKHPHTVRIFDYGKTEKGVPYLVMEKLEGTTLKKVFSKAPLNHDIVEEILRQILGSLAEAHQLGVVHRDLKLDNVFLCEASTPGVPDIKVIDFGLAKVLEFGDSLEARNLTADGILVGTPGYMAPEVLKGKPVTPQADLYVVGIIGYELLTGEPAYSGDPLQRARAQSTSDPAAPDEEIEKLPVYVVIKRLLARKPSKRYVDAAEALHDLENLDQLVIKGKGWFRKLFRG